MNTGLKRQADELAAREILVSTNEGTYSTTEAVKATGSGDPAHNTWRTFQRVGDGRRSVRGCNQGRAPGYARYLNADELAAAQKALADLRAEIERQRQAA